eukprot:8462454-Karenia_brevis.AAC.1
MRTIRQAARRKTGDTPTQAVAGYASLELRVGNPCTNHGSVEPSRKRHVWSKVAGGSTQLKEAAG